MDRPDDGTFSQNSHEKAVTPVAARHIFREMIKAEIEAQPLTRARRQELVDFAAHLDIACEEAKLLLRAVEIECENPTLDRQETAKASVEQSYVAAAPDHPTSLAIATLLLAILLGGFLLAKITF